MSSLVVVNFGGPRNLEEVSPFLTQLLTDPDVIRTSLPRFIEKWLFKRVARKRAPKTSEEYAQIGGKSPIFDDTEAIAGRLQCQTCLPVLTFHRYLPATHASFLNAVCRTPSSRIVIPLYPQFSYSTTGSVARFFRDNLPSEVVKNMHWISSYPTYPPYIQAMQECIRDFLEAHRLRIEEVFLFFSAHGLPQKFIDEGDPYKRECELCFHAIRSGFPRTLALLAFQSQFGSEEWIRPYTRDLAENPHAWNQGRQHIVFVPLSFTTDHLETLFEIEYGYLPKIRQKGLCAYRCPALNRRSDWIESLKTATTDIPTTSNQSLLRQ